MKKITFMVIMFVMLMTNVVFGAERRVGDFYADDLFGSYLAPHEVVEEGTIYRTETADNGTYCVYWIEDGTVTVEMHYQNGMVIDDLRLKRLTNGTDSLIMYSYGCTEGAFISDWAEVRGE